MNTHDNRRISRGKRFRMAVCSGIARINTVDGEKRIFGLMQIEIESPVNGKKVKLLEAFPVRNGARRLISTTGQIDMCSQADNGVSL